MWDIGIWTGGMAKLIHTHTPSSFLSWHGMLTFGLCVFAVLCQVQGGPVQVAGRSSLLQQHN